jgi:hypothetical protein
LPIVEVELGLQFEPTFLGRPFQVRGGAVNQTYFGAGSAEVVARVELTAGRTYDLRVDYSSQGATLLTGVRLGYLPPVAEDSIARAATLAGRSDVALVFVGLNGDWESEGHDRPDMELVGEQVALIEQVAAANPNTVVVLQTGSPIAMPWLEQVAGVIQGWYPGQEIVQLYVHDHAARLSRPDKELKGFAKLALAPGVTATVTLALDKTALAYWDDARHAWVAEAGAFEVLVGGSSRDIRARAGFQLTETAIFGGPPRQRVVLSVDSPVKLLLEDDNARAVIAKHLPDFAEHAGMSAAMGLTLAQVAGFAPDQITPEALRTIAEDLRAGVAASE